MRVAFLGLGIMGGGMASRLVSMGFPLTVYNRTCEKAQRYAASGAFVAGTPREASARAEVVIAMVAGLEKRAALLGALRAGLMDVLITDESTARAVLKAGRGA